MHGPKQSLFLTSSLCIACLSMSQTHDHWPPSINMYEINWGAESWSLWLNVLVPKFKEFAILISSSGLLLTLCPLQKINLRSEMMCLRIMRFWPRPAVQSLPMIDSNCGTANQIFCCTQWNVLQIKENYTKCTEDACAIMQNKHFKHGQSCFMPKLVKWCHW